MSRICQGMLSTVSRKRQNSCARCRGMHLPIMVPAFTSRKATTPRRDPIFKLALGRLPLDEEFRSQSTILRLENLPDARAPAPEPRLSDAHFGGFTSYIRRSDTLETLQRKFLARPQGLRQGPKIKRLASRSLVGTATQPPILFMKQLEGRVRIVGHDTAVDLVERRLAEQHDQLA